MSATLSLTVFWGVILAIQLISRIPASHFELDHTFSNTMKGVAMFIILYHHSGIYHSKELWFFFLSGWGFCGVSLFFLISGFGLMVSYEKNNYRFWTFLKKRFLSIWPIIILCMIVRSLISPAMIIDVPFPLSFVKLLGFQEWFIIAISCWYLVFITIVRIVDKSDIAFVFALVSVCLWALLDIGFPSSGIAFMWMRFPFSFALGVIFGRYSKFIINYFQQRLLLTTLLSLAAVSLSINLQNQKNLVYPMLDLSILPLGVCAVIWLYKLKLNSNLIQFMGKYSLPLYLMQIPLIKYGIFMKEWRNDTIGLLATWLVIFVLSFLIIQSRAIVDNILQIINNRIGFSSG